MCTNAHADFGIFLPSYIIRIRLLLIIIVKTDLQRTIIIAMEFRKHFFAIKNPVSILHTSIAGRYRQVRVADGPITARCRFM